jgi:hypothetical protein
LCPKIHSQSSSGSQASPRGGAEADFEARNKIITIIYLLAVTKALIPSAESDQTEEVNTVLDELEALSVEVAIVVDELEAPFIAPVEADVVLRGLERLFELLLLPDVPGDRVLVDAAVVVTVISVVAKSLVEGASKFDSGSHT